MYFLSDEWDQGHMTQEIIGYELDIPIKKYQLLDLTELSVLPCFCPQIKYI